MKMNSFYKTMYAGLASSVAAVALSGSVSAADLGGGCCADLEERVAELEATVARKGNRVVTLQIYGDVTQGLMVFDNGEESDAYVVDNDALGSIVGFTGEAKLKPGWKAGYKMELQIQSAPSSTVTEDDNGDDPSDVIAIRHNFVYVESERFGRISLGQTSTASDGAAQVSIANTLVGNASPDQGTSLSPGGVGAGGFLGDYAADFDGGRDDVVRYDSPAIYGFILSAAWGDDDYWDIAARFSKQFNSVKVAAAIAYADSESDSIGFFDQVIGSISAMHVPTGLFATFAAGEREFDNGLDGSFYYIQGGIERKWLSYGTTTVYGEYGSYDNVSGSTVVVDDTVVPEFDAEATMWGFGVVQHVDAAAMDVYAQARFWEVDDNNNPDADELSVFMIGSRIQF